MLLVNAQRNALKINVEEVFDTEAADVMGLFESSEGEAGSTRRQTQGRIGKRRRQH
jgi:hypothetical protein